MLNSSLTMPSTWPIDNVLTISLVVFTTSIFVYVIYQKFLSPLAKIDGPFLASLSPLWKLYAFKKGNFHETILALHHKYGPIVRIAPTEVIISEKTAIKEIYSTVQGRDYLKVNNLMTESTSSVTLLMPSRRTITSTCPRLPLFQFCVQFKHHIIDISLQ